MKKIVELPIPISREEHPSAVEVLRIWADEGQFFSLNPDVVDDPFEWGMILVDVARHVARAYAYKNKNFDVSKSLERIKQGFDTEWNNPTDVPKGGLTT